MKIEPVNSAFEAEVARIAGPRRKGESVDEHLHRISRVRQMQRAEQAIYRLECLLVDMAHWSRRIDVDYVRREIDAAVYGSTQ